MTDKFTDIFVDFDDTLYDTRGNNTLALRELYDARDWSSLIPDFEIFSKSYWKTNEHVWSLYSHKEITREQLIVARFMTPLKECLLPGTDSSWITEDYCRDVSDQYLDFCSCKPGTVEGAHELMQYLKGRGYRLHICSNGFHEVQYKKLRASNMLDYFDTIILSEDAGENKPGKGFFDYALSKTGASKETTLMIGDNYTTDILGALNYGIPSIWFNRWNEEKSLDPRIAFTTSNLLDIKKLQAL